LNSGIDVKGSLYIGFSIVDIQAPKEGEMSKEFVIEVEEEPEKQTPELELIKNISSLRFDKVKDLIEWKEMNPEVVDLVTGNHSLHLVILSGPTSVDMFKYFLSKNCDVNAQNRKGDTPLHIAVSIRNELYIRLLLEKKANPNIQNTFLKTPIESVGPEYSEQILAIYKEFNINQTDLKVIEKNSTDETVAVYLRKTKHSIQISSNETAFDLIKKLAEHLKIAQIENDLQLTEESKAAKIVLNSSENILSRKHGWIDDETKFVLEVKRGSSNNSQMIFRSILYEKEKDK